MFNVQQSTLIEALLGLRYGAWTEHRLICIRFWTSHLKRIRATFETFFWIRDGLASITLIQDTLITNLAQHFMKCITQDVTCYGVSFVVFLWVSSDFENHSSYCFDQKRLNSTCFHATVLLCTVRCHIPLRNSWMYSGASTHVTFGH